MNGTKLLFLCFSLIFSIASPVLASETASNSADTVAGLPAGFDPKVYLSLNPDLKAYIDNNPAVIAAAGGEDKWVINHYLNSGKNEKRQYQLPAVVSLPAGFDPKVYISLNPDLKDYIDRHPEEIAAAGGADQWAINHYLSHGKGENRAFQSAQAAAPALAAGLPEGFDPKVYVALNPDLQHYMDSHPEEVAAGGGADQWAINHYISHGRNENRQYQSKENASEANLSEQDKADLIAIKKPEYVAARNTLEEEIAAQVKRLMTNSNYAKNKETWGLLSQHSERLVSEIVRDAPQTPIYIDGVDKQIMTYDWRNKDFLFLTHSRSFGEGYSQELIAYKNRIAANGMSIPENNLFHLDVMPFMSCSLSDAETTPFSETTNITGVAQIVFDIDKMAAILTATVDAYVPQGRSGLPNTITQMLKFINKEVSKKEAVQKMLSTDEVIRNTLFHFNEINIAGNHLAKKMGATKPLIPLAILVPDSIFNTLKISQIMESERPRIIKARQEFIDGLEFLSQHGIPIILVTYQSKGALREPQQFDYLIYSKARGSPLKILEFLIDPMKNIIKFSDINEFKNIFDKIMWDFPYYFASIDKSAYFAPGNNPYAQRVNVAINQIIQFKKMFMEQHNNKYKWEDDENLLIYLVSKVYEIKSLFDDAYLEYANGLLKTPLPQDEIDNLNKTIDKYKKNKSLNDQLRQSYLDKIGPAASKYSPASASGSASSSSSSSSLASSSSSSSSSASDVVNLSMKNIGDQGAHGLVETLPLTTKGLILDSNKIGPIGIAALAKRLHTLGHLIDLHFDNNNLGNEGMKILAPKLPSSLIYFSFNINNVGNEGLAALADNFPPNLKELALSSNPFTSTGIAYFINHMREPNRLTGIYIDEKKLSEEVKAALKAKGFSQKGHIWERELPSAAAPASGAAAPKS